MVRTVILALIVVSAAIASIMGGRGFMGISLPRVTRVAELPAKVDKAKFENFLSYGAFLPKKKVVPPPGGGPLIMPLLEDGAAPALGYSYREFSIFGLPLTAKTDLGLVLYREGSNGYQVVPMDQGYLDTLEKETGTRLEAGYTFPFWQFIWGWIFVVALLVWLVLKFADEARQRRESGEI